MAKLGNHVVRIGDIKTDQEEKGKGCIERGGIRPTGKKGSSGPEGGKTLSWGGVKKKRCTKGRHNSGKQDKHGFKGGKEGTARGKKRKMRCVQHEECTWRHRKAQQNLYNKGGGKVNGLKINPLQEGQGKKRFPYVPDHFRRRYRQKLTPRKEETKQLTLRKKKRNITDASCRKGGRGTGREEFSH